MVAKKEDLKKQKLLKKQLQKVDQKEKKLLKKKQSNFTKEKLTPLQVKLEEKIPKKVQKTLESAFESGFKLIFEKGIGIIEKSYNKEAQCVDFDIKHYAVQRQMSMKNLNKIDKVARKEVMLNHFLTTVEGSVLGALGIGIPDIPLFIGMMLKNIYQISLSYGFDYTEEKEKLYILYLICAGASKEDRQAKYNICLNEIAEGHEEQLREKYHLEDVIKEVAQCLAEAMLIPKFIQGLPIVGVVGGLSNWSMMKAMSDMAKVKYKKRYLKEKLM